MRVEIKFIDSDFTSSVLDMLTEIVSGDDTGNTCRDEERKCCGEDDRVGCDFYRSRFSEPTTTMDRPCRNERPLPEWGIAGKPANEALRFGAGFEIDEPRAEDYDKRWQFESDHAAFDRFVDAGEDCVARGMEKKSDAPIHKVNAIRNRIEDGPVFGVNLIGETHWF